MSILLLIISIILLFTLILQAILLIPSVFTSIINNKIKSLHIVDFRFKLQGNFFLLLPSFFYGKNVFFQMVDGLTGETFRGRVNRIRFRIKILPLLRGKLRIVNIHLEKPKFNLTVFKPLGVGGEYPRKLPRYGEIRLINLNITNGNFKILDKSLLSPMDLKIHEIFIYGGNMDLGSPVSLFFLSRKGSAIIDNAPVAVERGKKKNRIRLQGLQIKKLAGLGSFLVQEGKLFIDYSYEVLKSGKISGQMRLEINDFLVFSEKDYVTDSTTGNLSEEKATGKKTIANSVGALIPKKKSPPIKPLQLEVRPDKGISQSFPFSFLLKDMEDSFDRSLSKLFSAIFMNLTVNTVNKGFKGTVKKAWKGISNLFKGNDE